MTFNFETAVKHYKENPTNEKLNEVAEKLLGEMTTKEKIRMMQGHAMANAFSTLCSSSSSSW